MITIEKLKEYEKYYKYPDLFHIQKSANNNNLISDDEWFLLNILLQDFELVSKELASKVFSEKVEQKLKENFDSQESIDYFQKLADEEW